MTTTDPIAAFLGEGDYDGEKSEALKFPTLGTTHRGTISKEPKVIETEDKFGKNGGRPVQKLLVTLTIEGTEYALWVQGQMRQAIKEAIDAAGRGLAVGGVLAVKYAEDKDTGKPQPMKVYRAKYEPPAPAAAPDVDDFFGGPAAPAAPAANTEPF